MIQEKMYQDEFQVYELLDRWNSLGPPKPEHVLELFRQQPMAAKREFAYGQTLLHKCLQHYPNHIDLVNIFMNSYPEALLKQDNEGYMPIHRALSAEKQPSLELVKLLILEAPETILESTLKGEYPLHLACRRCNDASIVKYVIDCFPEITSYRDKEGNFPLDHAVLMIDDGNKQVDPNVLQILLSQNSVFLTFLDDDGRLPLHRILSKSHKRWDTIVELLIDSCPGTLRFQNTHGQTPLLQACSDHNSLSQIYSLIRKWPEQVTNHGLFYETTFNGELLPSALVSKSSRLDRVKEWVRIHPEVLHCPDQQGRLPLHYAAVSQSEEALEIVKFLVEESPEAASRPDSHCRLALHYACAAPEGFDGNRINEEIINKIIGSHREGLIHADSDDRLPWHYADCVRKSHVFDATLVFFPDLETDLDFVPDEIRWDIVQVLPEDN